MRTSPSLSFTLLLWSPLPACHPHLRPPLVPSGHSPTAACPLSLLSLSVCLSLRPDTVTVAPPVCPLPLYPASPSLFEFFYLEFSGLVWQPLWQPLRATVVCADCSDHHFSKRNEEVCHLLISGPFFIFFSWCIFGYTAACVVFLVAMYTKLICSICCNVLYELLFCICPHCCLLVTKLDTKVIWWMILCIEYWDKFSLTPKSNILIWSFA